MTEECPFCGAIFTVHCLLGDGICGAQQEPIDCPYCHKTVRYERTTGVFNEILVKIPDSPLSRYLGITDNEWDELCVELHAYTGNSDEQPYSYWFSVPDGISSDILDKTGWKIGQVINDIPNYLVDSDQKILPTNDKGLI